MSRYYGEVINLSLRDISMLKKFKIVDIKKRFLGLVKIYTVCILHSLQTIAFSSLFPMVYFNILFLKTIYFVLLHLKYLTYLEKVLHLFMEKCLIYPMQKIKKIGMN